MGSAHVLPVAGKDPSGPSFVPVATKRATTVAPASMYRASVTRQSEEARIHPARKSSSNSVGVLNVMLRAWSVQRMVSAYFSTIAPKSLRLKASCPARWAATFLDSMTPPFVVSERCSQCVVSRTFPRPFALGRRGATARPDQTPVLEAVAPGGPGPVAAPSPVGVAPDCGEIDRGAAERRAGALARTVDGSAGRLSGLGRALRAGGGR